MLEFHLILPYSSLEVRLNFSNSVGIPVDSVSLIIQLIKKPGLSQVENEMAILLLCFTG